MSAIDAAKAHFQLFKTRVVEVPEWPQDDGTPTLIYCEPLSLLQKQRVGAFADQMGQGEVLARTLILLAKTADGKALFTIEDKHALMHKVDPDVVARVVREMTRARSAEDQEKN